MEIVTISALFLTILGNALNLLHIDSRLQPYYPHAVQHPFPTAGRFLVYLDAWRREGLPLTSGA